MSVAPILDHSAASWGNKQFSQIDSVQNKAMKFFSGSQKLPPQLLYTVTWIGYHVM